MPDRLVIVVPYSEEQATRSRIAELAVFGWEQHLRLVGGTVRRGGGYDARVASARKILEVVDEFDANSLIVAKEVICDSSTIEERDSLDYRPLHLRILRDRQIPRELLSMGLQWRQILGGRLAYWSSRKIAVDDWLRQFDELGTYWVGEALLRQIDVIGPNEVVQAFQMPAEVLGPDCIFTFISDDDPAASSNRMGALLTQMYGRAHVKHFVAALTDSSPGGRLIVCEDGLWTGIELRNLLARLSAGGDLEQAVQGKRITFRHCVVADYGLWITKQFLDHKKLHFVDLSLGGEQRSIEVLARDISETDIRSRWGMPPIEFEDWLTTHVRPIAFQNEALWGGRAHEAQQICTEIGKQLIDKYVRDGEKVWRDGVQNGFALGAGRFGSATAFGHSVPKVCLPVLWLEGQVTLGPISLNWKPLFYDARRASWTWP
jgi:hypothetical protein